MYAAVSSSSVTSPVPSASDGTIGSCDSMPEPLRVIDGGADADLLKQLCGGAVARHFERAAKRVLSLLVPAAGKPRLVPGRDRRVEIAQQRSRRIAALERRRVDDRLERRTGLTTGLGGAIEAARVEIAAADERAHVTSCGIHGDEAALQISRSRPRLHDLRNLVVTADSA